MREHASAEGGEGCLSGRIAQSPGIGNQCRNCEGCVARGCGGGSDLSRVSSGEEIHVLVALGWSELRIYRRGSADRTCSPGRYALSSTFASASLR
jgi:hypothetical protein